MGLKIIPMGKHVYCQLDRVEEKVSQGGIILPDQHSEGTRLAKVLAKGPDVSDRIEVGAVYAVDWYSGIKLHFVSMGVLDDTKRLMSESELMARIEEEPDGDS